MGKIKLECGYQSDQSVTLSLSCEYCLINSIASFMLFIALTEVTLLLFE